MARRSPAADCLDFRRPQVYPRFDRSAVSFFGYRNRSTILTPRTNNWTLTRPAIFNGWIRMASLAAALAATVVLASCKVHPESAQAPANSAVKKVALGPDEPTKAMPPDLFHDMPMYPGVVVMHVRRPKGMMREILFQTDAEFDKLVSFYHQQLTDHDYHVTSSLIMRAVRKWSCDFNKRGRLGSITLYPSDHDKSKMTIDLIYELPSKQNQAMLAPVEKFDVEGPGPVAQQAPSPNEKHEKTKRN
jgi:hypothetical protein